MENVVRIRSAHRNEWRVWKDIRLEALQDAPESFGERYQDAMEKDDARWQRDFQKVMESEKQEIFFAAADNLVVGLLFVFVRDQDTKIGGIGGLWIAPEYRKKGIGKQIVEKAMEWMRGKNLQAVTFWNNKSGEASSKFYEKLGFTYTGIEKPLESNSKCIIGEMRKEL